jgi:hypothetical protein
MSEMMSANMPVTATQQSANLCAVWTGELLDDHAVLANPSPAIGRALTQPRASEPDAQAAALPMPSIYVCRKASGRSEGAGTIIDGVRRGLGTRPYLTAGAWARLSENAASRVQPKASGLLHGARYTV